MAEFNSYFPYTKLFIQVLSQVYLFFMLKHRFTWACLLQFGYVIYYFFYSIRKYHIENKQITMNTQLYYGQQTYKIHDFTKIEPAYLYFVCHFLFLLSFIFYSFMAPVRPINWGDWGSISKKGIRIEGEVKEFHSYTFTDLRQSKSGKEIERTKLRHQLKVVVNLPNLGKRYILITSSARNLPHVMPFKNYVGWKIKAYIVPKTKEGGQNLQFAGEARLQKIFYLKCPQNLINKFKNKRNNWKSNFQEKMKEKLGNDASGLLLTLAFGNKEGLTAAFITRLKELGLLHLFVLSGMHVHVILLANEFFCRQSRFRILGKIVLSFGVLNLYGYLTAWQASISRAIWQCHLANIFKIAKVRVHPWQLWQLLVIFYLLFLPYELFNLGWLMSILITQTIILFFHPPYGKDAAEEEGEKKQKRAYKNAIKILKLHLFCQITLLPFYCVFEQKISIIAFILPLLIGPYVLLLTLFSLFCIYFYPIFLNMGVFHVFIKICSILLNGLLVLIKHPIWTKLPSFQFNKSLLSFTFIIYILLLIYFFHRKPSKKKMIC